MCKRAGRRGFTLIELLAVIGVIAVLAGILVPVFVLARENSRRGSCAANVKQLGAALLLYAQDNDEQGPNSALSHKITRKAVPIALGWAGRVYPYVKQKDVFACPSDATKGRKDTAGAEAAAVSYGLNENVSLAPHLADFAAPAKTVWLFEVTGNHARIAETDEGVTGLSEADQLSAVGDGTNGGLLDVVQVAPRLGRTRYATGKLDNADALLGDGADDYQDEAARHRGGANYLAADGHAAYVVPLQVSAGQTAKADSAAQTNTGCAGLNPAVTRFPCAEGTMGGRHMLTFSVR